MTTAQDQTLARAVAAHNARRFPEAESLYREILRQSPDHAGALHLLGILSLHTNRLVEAAELLARAVAIAPDVAQFHYDLSLALTQLGRSDGAIASVRRAIALQPDYAEAHNQLGLLLAQKCSGATDAQIIAQTILDESIAAFRKAVALQPKFLPPRSNLAGALATRGYVDEAIAELTTVISQKPDYAQAHNNLGSVLVKAGRDADALASYRKAIALDPKYAQAHYNLASSLKTLGHLDEAIKTYDQAIAIDPQFADAHWNVGLLLLLRGDLRRGFAEFEWRRKANFGDTFNRKFSQSLWDGSDPAGQRILIHSEQGFGDIIQMIRYAPMLAERGAKIIIECQPELRRLFAAQQIAYVERVIEFGQSPGEYDFHAPIMSLPFLMGTSALDSIPSAVPYLSADPTIVELWKNRIGNDSRLRVGLAWAGRATQANDHNRSMPLSTLAPLFQIPGIHFISLQKRRSESEPPTSFPLTDWSDDLTDFAETAGLIANLDLVISVDTAVAHLSAALAKPTWVFLTALPDWRWLLDRPDSPWYPTMRLYRQSPSTRGDSNWAISVSRVTEDLRVLGDQNRRAP